MQALECFLSTGEGFPSEVQVVAVVAADRKEAVVERVEAAVHEERNRQEFARGLAHLAKLLFGRAVFELFFASCAEEFAVHPETGERNAVGAFALGDFVRVVHADVVGTAAVNVERRAVILHGHGGAFDVPAGETNAPRAVPFHGALLVLRAELPQSEVGSVVLFAHVDAASLAEVFHVEACKVGIARELEAVEVNAVARAVGVALFFERLHQVNLFLDVLRGRRPAGRFLDVEAVPVGHESVGVELRDVPNGLAFAGCALFHLVVARVSVACEVAHVGDVHDVVHLVAVVVERTDQEVFENVSAEVADVGEMVHRRAATVHAHGGNAFRKCENFFLTRCSVVELKCHKASG